MSLSPSTLLANVFKVKKFKFRRVTFIIWRKLTEISKSRTKQHAVWL